MVDFFFQADANKTKSEPAKSITLPFRVTCLPFRGPLSGVPTLLFSLIHLPLPCLVLIQSLGLHWPGSQPCVHPIWELLVLSSDLLEVSLRVEGILVFRHLLCVGKLASHLPFSSGLLSQAPLPLMISHMSEKQGCALIHRLEATFILQFPRLSVPSNGSEFLN